MARFSHFLITGGAGFIGSHTARAAAAAGASVTLLDNLSRRGAVQNLDLLRRDFPAIRHIHGDIRDGAAVLDAVRAMPHGGVTAVIHQASQVAVTTSVANPRLDFEINALGTLNVLEAVRATDPSMPVLFSSTNKVYGGLEDEGIIFDQSGPEYRYAHLPEGVAETQPLDFHSPYGCSKGAADQYMHDYARIYGLRTIVFRQSCIYGTHQFGVEDQGWVAWFVIAAILGRPITIFGDGCQVRDVLWVGDLVEAYFSALDRIDACAGSVLNIGGGPANRMTLRQLIAFIEAETGRPLPRTDAPWRPGDQRVYVSNIARARQVLGWQPRTSPREGVSRLLAWVRDHRDLLESILPR